MKEIKAPLCKRCASMLHGKFLSVSLIGETGSSQEECPWCERNSAEAFYIIQPGEKR